MPIRYSERDTKFVVLSSENRHKLMHQPLDGTESCESESENGKEIKALI